MPPRTSAGLLLYRVTPDAGVEVLLGHMGGPFWARRDRAWTIPKGEFSHEEDPKAAALREFEEELGTAPPTPSGPDHDLGSIRQSGGKTVFAWAREAAQFEPGEISANLVEIEWPPRSGRRIEVPELDRAEWVRLDDARGLIVAAQAELLDRLARALTQPDPAG